MNTRGPDERHPRSALGQMVMDSPRQFVDGALLVTMVALLCAMLSVPRMDQPLNVAVNAFVFAILCFLWSWYWASDPIPPESHSPFTRLLETSGTVADFLGEAAFAIGFGSVIAHLIPHVLTVLGVAAALVISLSVIGAAVIYVFTKRGGNARQPAR